jgi:hypothetical protein
MFNVKRAEIPKQIVKLNQAVETLASLEYSDLELVRAVVSKIRWQLGEVNLELCELLNEDQTSVSENQTVLL